VRGSEFVVVGGLPAKTGITIGLQSVTPVQDYFRPVRHPKLTVSKPFTGLSPFEVARAIIPGGASSMPRYGVMGAVAKNKKGVFVLAAEGVERDELSYKQRRACRLPLPPGRSSIEFATDEP
jgi:hypothetical protein